MRIAEQVRSFRHRHGLSKVDLARLLELPEPERGGRVTIARWEKGAQEPGPYLPLALKELDRQLRSADSARITRPAIEIPEGWSTTFGYGARWAEKK